MSRSGLPALILAALGLTGCYADPGDLVPEEVLGLTIEAAAPEADGASEALVVLSFSGDATAGVAVHLRTSAGAWRAGDGQGVETTVRIPAGPRADLRTLEVPLALPRTPGDLRVEAEVGGVLAVTRLAVDPALPDEVVAGTSRAALPADGQSVAHLSFDLPRAVGRPSLGTRLALAACCLGSDDQPTACPFAAPLRIPSAVRLTDATADDRLTVDAVADPLRPDQVPAGGLDMVVVATPRAPDDATGTTCAPNQGAEIRLTLTVPDGAE